MKFNINLADEYFLLNPELLNTTSNKKLYYFCNAKTDVQKQNLRRRKKQLKEKVIVSDPKLPGRKKLTEEYIEKKIYEGLEANPGNAQLIGKATEFYLKISSKKEILDDDLDMELLKKIGIKIFDSE